jgi:hypothetical protein
MAGIRIISSITVDGKTCGPDVIRKAVETMTGEFTNMQIAGAIGRAGFAADDFWLCQEIANRLLQRVRRAGLATCPDRRVWSAVEGGVLAAIERQNG